MDSIELKKVLLSYGMSRFAADEICQRHLADERKTDAIKRANDWNFVLKPLKMQIRALQSSKYRWIDDEHRAPVYGAYLSVLLKVRTRIETVRKLNFEGKTIPQIAKEHGLPLDGLRWTAYVPETVKLKHTLAFQKLYEETLPAAALRAGRKGRGPMDSVTGGKRIIPFSTKTERNISDKRWDALYVQLVMEIEGRAGVADEQRPLIDALEEALTVVNRRKITDEAPYNNDWEKLLTPQTAGRLEAWRANSMEGLDAHKLLEAQRAQQTERMLAMDAEKERKRLRQNGYTAKYQAKLRAQKAGNVFPGDGDV